MGTRGFKVKRFFENIIENVNLFFQDVGELFRKIRDHNITFKIGRSITKTIKKLWHNIKEYVLGWEQHHSSSHSFKFEE